MHADLIPANQTHSMKHLKILQELCSHCCESFVVQFFIRFYTGAHYTITGWFRVELSFFDCVDRGANVTRVTIPTARYLATRKILKKFLRIKSHHHDNGNVSNRTSMDTGLFNTNL
jgi:hypothetical protein